MGATESRTRTAPARTMRHEGRAVSAGETIAILFCVIAAAAMWLYLEEQGDE